MTKAQKKEEEQTHTHCHNHETIRLEASLNFLLFNYKQPILGTKSKGDMPH